MHHYIDIVSPCVFVQRTNILFYTDAVCNIPQEAFPVAPVNLTLKGLYEDAKDGASEHIRAIQEAAEKEMEMNTKMKIKEEASYSSAQLAGGLCSLPALPGALMKRSKEVEAEPRNSPLLASGNRIIETAMVEFEEVGDISRLYMVNRGPFTASDNQGRRNTLRRAKELWLHR